MKRSMKAFVVLLAPGLLVPSLAQGQVGNDPAHSPFRDLRYGQFVTLTAGQMFGSGGKLGIGPHHGPVVMLRHDFLADHPLSLALAFGFARLDRNFVDLTATTPTDKRLKGPVRHNMWFGEGNFQLNLTGGKTWHGLAPFVGLGFGLAVTDKIKQDSSKYSFGTRFYLIPAAGVRYFVTRRMFLKAEARVNFWNLRYPDTYRTDPDGAFGPLGRLITGEPKEWTPTAVIHAGVGFAFHRPFF